MKRTIGIFLMTVSCAISAGAQQKDDAKCKDHPLFTRMPTYWIRSCDQKEFEAYKFEIGQGKTQTVEGEYWRINYHPQNTATSKPSQLQILRNYENAGKKLNATVLFQTKDRETLKLTRGGKEVWVDVRTSYTGSYSLFIVEKKAMEQDIVANADAFLDDLKRTGHAAVYGIYFDTGKSTLKPESEQSVAEIAKLLKKEMSLNLYVVGHTDNVGGLESNMKLSQDRAGAVVEALVKTHGIPPARLKSFGNGPYAPVESNDTEEGKGRNRRVELVKQ
jgi:outer membrane protein OmpA-like peptidoglycan-associated protein